MEESKGNVTQFPYTQMCVVSLLQTNKKTLFEEKLAKNQKGPKTNYFQTKRKPLLNRMLYYDTKSWLPNYPLFINDRMTMANSIEGRVPFLDHNLVEYVNTLNPKLKLNGKTNKFILRQAMKKTLPARIANVKKHAFFMPLDKWYKEELKDLAESLFTPKNVKDREYFNHNHLKKIWDNYNHSKLIYGKQLFTLINFELWHRMFIDTQKISLNNKIKLSSLL